MRQGDRDRAERPLSGRRRHDGRFDATYRVDIEGDPDIHCAMNLGDAEGHGAGHAAMAATAMRVVNATPFVVDAPTGLLSSLDMPNTLPRHVFD